MFNRKWIFGAIVASAIGATALPALAAVYVDVAPPSPREEVIPTPRHGYVWAPGYWDWRNGRYHWVRGHWVRERHGMYWHPGHWVEREGRWVFVQPGWHNERFAYGYGRGYAWRDNDKDGVPNRYDRAPNNPNRQ